MNKLRKEHLIIFFERSQLLLDLLWLSIKYLLRSFLTLGSQSMTYTPALVLYSASDIYR